MFHLKKNKKKILKVFTFEMSKHLFLFFLKKSFELADFVRNFKL